MNLDCCTRRGLLVGAAFGALLTTPAAGQTEPGRQTIRRFETIQAGGRVLAINHFGSVDARFGGYEHRIELVATAQRLDRELPELELRTETVGGGLDISVVPRGGGLPYSGPERRDRIDLVLFVPLGVPLDVQTLDDPISVEGLKSDVAARSHTGDIHLRSIGGRVRANSVSGKILAILNSRATGLPQELSTETGEIETHLWEDAHLRVEIATSGEISTDFSLTIEHTRFEEPAKHARATVGGGGPLLTLRSKRGRIRLLRMSKR